MSNGKTYGIRCDDPPASDRWIPHVVEYVEEYDWRLPHGMSLWTNGETYVSWWGLLNEYGPAREVPPEALEGTTIILLASGESSGRPFMDEVLVSGSIYGLWCGNVKGRYVDLQGDDEITEWKVLGVVGKDGVLKA